MAKIAYFSGISVISLEISASEELFSDSGKWPFHTPPIHTPTKCRPTKFLEVSAWLPLQILTVIFLIVLKRGGVFIEQCW